MKHLISAVVALLFITTGSISDDHYLKNIPKEPDVSKNYLFYLHGAIIERGDLSPEHPKFGLYDMPGIRTALVSENTVLISDQRPQGTRPMAYADKLTSDIKSLLTAGVPPENITVSGFSKGSMITILTSSKLKNNHVNFVFMAACNARLFNNEKIVVMGRILSLYETSDTIGKSCAPLIAKSPSVTVYEEIALSTGKMHGAFYLPRDEWVKPLKTWATGSKVGSNQP